MKRIVALIMIAACVCVLAGCGTKSVSEAEIVYGNSAIYSEADMNGAIKLIIDEFSTWDGCELHRIQYAGDEHNSDENIAWMNDLATGQDLAGNYTQCIMFESSFHSPKRGGGAWNANTEYNWQWWLARAQGGEWELLTWGS